MAQLEDLAHLGHLGDDRVDARRVLRDSSSLEDRFVRVEVVGPARACGAKWRQTARRSRARSTRSSRARDAPDDDELRVVQLARELHRHRDFRVGVGLRRGVESVSGMGRDRRRASRSRTAWYTGSSGSAVACCCICICAAAFCFRFELIVLALCASTRLALYAAHSLP